MPTRTRPWRTDADTTPPAPLWWVPAATVAAVVVVLAGSNLHNDASRVLPGLWFAVTGTVLAAADVDVMRLPNKILGPATLVQALILTGTALVVGTPGRLLTAFGMALALPTVMYLWGVQITGSMGLGDVKLMALTGLSTGWISWQAALAGLAYGILIGGAIAAGLLVQRRRNGSTARDFPYGPWLIAGTVLAYLHATG